MIIQEPLFDSLRTKQQLGYHVDCTLRDTNGVLGYTITVHTQATKFDPGDIDEKIEDFNKKMQKLFARMSNKTLNKWKRDLIKVKMVEDVDLDEEVSRNWSEIINQDYLFDRNAKEISAIDKIVVNDLKKWWDAHSIYPAKTKGRKLSLQIVGHKGGVLEGTHVDKKLKICGKKHRRCGVKNEVFKCM